MLHKQTIKDIVQIANFPLGIMAISILLAAISQFYAHWIFDLFAHFQIQYAIGAALLGSLFASFKCWKRLGITSAFLVFTVFQIYSSFDFTASTASTDTFKIIQYNRYVSLQEHDELIEFLKKETPDVAIIQEAAQSHSSAINSLLDQYPYQIHEPRTNAFGMVIISKHPFKKQKVKVFEQTVFENFQIKIELNVHGNDLSIYAIHPPPPMNKELYTQRNTEISSTSEDVRHDPNDNIIMLGDWNISPFSKHFKDLTRHSKLKNQFTAPYTFPTWPSGFSLPILQIPIDHILHKGNLELVEKRRGPSLGSDHYPVVATYNFSAQN